MDGRDSRSSQNNIAGGSVPKKMDKVNKNLLLDKEKTKCGTLLELWLINKCRH